MSQSAQIERRKSLRELSGSLVSIVLPVYNEAEALSELLGLVQSTLERLDCRYEIVFVNDGSTDGSPMLLNQFAREDFRIRVVHFSRNFGHQAAVQAGLRQARGDAVVLMDSDLQDDPAAIEVLLEKWCVGFDVVYAVRFNRKESWWKRLLFYGFYRVLNTISSTSIPMDAGNFGLIDRSVLTEVVGIADSDRFYSGLRSWVGFRQVGVPVERLARHDHQPRVSMYQLFQLAKTAVFSFSRTPLSVFYAMAALSLTVCAASFGFTLYHRLFTALAIPGWTSTIMIASFFGALNSLGIGVLGEYVVRIYDQVRGRPAYIVREVVNGNAGRDAEDELAVDLAALIDDHLLRGDEARAPLAEAGAYE
ncbi:MAG: glycosyltransferase family 2 protein [Pirellulaceae bacterium]|jgi:dolichol-phosphate mannosyltransferase|nr:glycosyltransferase family 2 protein [Pirellulaceae bacterium]MDP7017964.1 glycosyltransferase family 2 protein [Pirellulaceae bacterium]